MHLEVKVALNFIMSYLYNRLPRRRAHLFGEELERLLVARFQGHWYPEAPLRGSAFRCLHLGAPPDPLVELAARRSGLDTEEVRANVPPGLSVWIDPYEVSYQIGEKGAVKVLYLEDPRAPPGGAGELGQHEAAGGGAELEEREGRSTGFNPEAQVFVPVGGLSSSPPSPLSCPGLGFGFPSPGLCPAPAAAPHSSSSSSSSCSSSSSTPPSSASSPPLGAAHPYPALPPQAAPPLPPPALPLARPAPQPLTFTTASFAATKFGSTKMKRSGLAGTGGGGGGGGSGGGGAVPQRMARSPTNVAHSLLGKQKPLSLSLHSLGGLGSSSSSSQLSPNAKEFVYPGSPGPLYFDADAPSSHASPFQPPPPPAHPHPSFDPFSSPPPGSGVGLVGGGGGISSSLYMDKPAYVDSLGGYNLQYPSQAFQPVVLAN